MAAVIVAGVVGWVAWKQKLAAEAQAAAAVQQTAAANVQADAAREQVIAAKQQTATALAIADKQTSPNLAISAVAADIRSKLFQHIAILNNGSGPAFGVTVRYNDPNGINDDLRVTDTTLVVQDSVSVEVEGSRAASSGLRISYTTSFGTKYILEFKWNGHISQAVQMKLYTE